MSSAELKGVTKRSLRRKGDSIHELRYLPGDLISTDALNDQRLANNLGSIEPRVQCRGRVLKDELNPAGEPTPAPSGSYGIYVAQVDLT